MEKNNEGLFPASLLSYAQLLANFIDSKAGDYPLISVLPSSLGAGILWQYSSHDFILYYEKAQRRFPSLMQLHKGSPSEISLLSLEDALELVRLTETVRQKTVCPHIALGRMPGTEFKPTHQEKPFSSPQSEIHCLPPALERGSTGLA